MISHLFLWGAFALLMGGAVTGYLRLKPALTQMYSQETEQLLQHTRLSRHISSIMSDANLALMQFSNGDIPGIFSENQDLLHAALQTLLEQVNEPKLREVIVLFDANLQTMFAQCSLLLQDITNANGRANNIQAELNLLSTAIAQNTKKGPLAEQHQHEEVITELQQSWQTLLAIERLRPLLERAPLVGNPPNKKKHIIPLLTRLENHTSRLAELLADIPEVDASQLQPLVNKYIQTQHALWQNQAMTLERFNTLLTSRAHLARSLEKLDEQAAGQGAKLLAQVQQKMLVASLSIVGLSALLAVLAFSFFTRTIRRHVTTPMRQMHSGIVSVTEGSFPPDVAFERKDEWENMKIALLGMANEMHNYYLFMENRNHELKEEILRRRISENEWCASREAFRSIFEYMDYGVFKITLNGALLECNPAFRKLIAMADSTPLDPENPPSIETLMPELDLPKLYRQLSEHDDIHFFDLQLQRSNKTRWISLYFKLKKGEQRHPAHIYGLARDVTDQKKQMEALRKAKETAEESAKTKSQFLANMSHEIRTPLGGVIGMTEMLSETPLDERQNKYVKAALQSAHSLMNIINDVLDFSKIEANRMKIDPVDFSLQEVLDSNLRSLGLQAKRKGLDFEIIVDEAVPAKLHGDPGRLGQILVNLVGNAIKFTLEGSVRLRVAPSFEFSKTGAQRYSFAVDDTGIGINPKNLQTIFDSFSQEDGSLTRQFGGTGLGLAISKRLAVLMDGSLIATNREGGGSTFELILPLPEATASEEKETKPEVRLNSQGLLGLRVLLAEDNAVNRLFATDLLRQAGMEVEEAENGRQALSMLQEKEFDLILMDIQMPLLDGIETTQLIRTSGAPYRDIPIIALTAHAMAHERQRFLDKGMNAHIAKPVDQKELFRILNTFAPLGKRQPATEGPAPEEPPILDTPAALTALMDNKNILKQMREKFIEQSQLWAEGLDGMKKKSDREKLADLLHSLLGSSGTLGAVYLRNVAEEMKPRVQPATEEELLEMADTISQALSRTIAAMTQERDNTTR